MLLLITVVISIAGVHAQYDDNPLKQKKWFSVTAGVNNMDYLSWQGMGTFSMRGETVLTQFRLGYSQEIVKAADDSCTDRHNRLTEAGIMWGDGWSGKKWYVTGAAGFGLNVRMFCRHTLYENQYITAVTLGIPFQTEFGVLFTDRFGMNIIGTANWNFRAPYIGGSIGAFWRLKKKK
ncbi:MAG: hypothetical protein K1X54_07760 [Flavobacteriales bacterium]|nr:hypothetical protein [Flavobacteriales bacterium]